MEEVPEAGGEYEIPEICCAAGDSDGAVCVFASASASRNRNRSRPWICGWATSLCVRILWLLSLRLCAVWLLWAAVFRGWSVCRCWPVVSLGPSGAVLE